MQDKYTTEVDPSKNTHSQKKALSAQILPFICSVLLLHLKSVLPTALGSSFSFPFVPSLFKYLPN